MSVTAPHRPAVPAGPRRGLLVRLVRRQLTADRWAALPIVLLVLVTTALGSAIVQTVDDASTRGLRALISEAGPRIRDFNGATVTSPLPSDPAAPVAPYDAMAKRVDAGPGQEVAGLVRPAAWTLTTPILQVAKPAPRPGPTRWFSLRVDPALPGLVDVVAGRLPAAASGGDLTLDPETGIPIGPAEFEAVLSRRAATVMKLRVGDVVSAGAAYPGEWLPPVRVRIVGLFEPRGEADAWQLDPKALVPGHITSDRLGDIWSGIAYVSPAALPVFHSNLAYARLRYDVRLHSDPARVLPEDVTSLLAGTRRATAQLVQVQDPVTGEPTQIGLDTDLDQLLISFLQQRAAVTALATVLLTGLAGSAAAVVLLATGLLLARRRDALALVLARGASPGQIAGVLAVEAVLLCVPAAVLAAGLCRWLLPGRAGLAGLLIAACAGLVPVLVLPLSAMPTALSAGGRADGPTTGRSARGLRGNRRDLLRRGGRWGLELLAVAVATAAVLAVHRRGVASRPGLPEAGAVVEEAVRGVDPLVALTPLLVSAAATLLLFRAVRLPVVLLSRRAAAGRGSVGFLGLARAERDATLGRLALLAVVSGLAVAVFAGVSGSTVAAGITRSAQLQVGGDAAVAGFGWRDGDAARLATVPALDRVAAAHVENDVSMRLDSGSPRTYVTLVAVDTGALAAVQSGRIADALDAETVRRLQVPPDPHQPIPVLLSTSAAASTELGPGGRTELTISGRVLPVRVIGTRDVLAGLPTSGSWLLVDRPGLRQRTLLELSIQRILTRTDGPAPDARGLLEAVRPVLPDVLAVQTRSTAAAAAADAPLSRTVRDALVPVLAIGCGYAAAAVTVALLAGARRRGRFVAHLRAVGLSTGQAARLVVAEVTPICLLGLAVGAAVGLGLARVLLPLADLSQLTGSALPVKVTTDPAVLALTAAALAVSLAVAVAVAAAVARRVSPATAARTIEGE